jgi:uncharacterized protein involved in exopolysaccharide biosynthesis/Mrp family chromosome partitioning ATPase
VSRPTLTVSVAEVAALVRDRAVAVLSVALVVMGAALAIGYSSPLVFVARGQLFLGEVVDAAAPDSATTSRDADGVSGEMEILGSVSLVERATLAAGLNADIGPARGLAPRYSEWLAVGQKYGALPRPDNELAVVNAVISGAQRATYAVELIDAARYRVLAGGVVLGEGRLGVPLELGDLSWTLLEGPARPPRPGARYEVVVVPAALAALEVVDRLQVSAPRASGSPHYGRIVALEFTAGSPYRAERFLTALLAAYLEQRHERKVGKLLAREAYLEGESRSVVQALDGIEQQLADVRASRRGLWLDDDDNPLFAERDRFEAAEARSMLEVARLNVYSESFGGVAPPLATFLQGESNDTQLEGLSAALSEAQRDLTDAQQAFAEGSTELREQEARVADRKAAIRRYVEGRLGRAKERQGLIGELVVENGRKLDTVEKSRRELAELTRDQSAYADTYTRLLKQKGEAGLVIAKAVSKDRIIDPPRSVAEPASPNLRQALSSGLFGLFLGFLWLLFRRLTAGTVQAESDAQRFLGDVPLLGAVPFHARRLERHARLSDALAQARVSDHGPYDESFRLLGLSLFGAQAEPHQQIIFITSPGWGDGKTGSALALGLALARRGRRVLIVDGSPVELARNEGPAEESDEPPSLGLEDVLTGRSTLRAARVTVPAGLGELHLLSAGTVNPDEPRATAEQLADFLDVARARYDGVLVDVPGHLPTNVMAAIGLADRVLLVLRLRHTSRHRLDELLGELPRERTGALVIDERRGRAARALEPRGLAALEEEPVAP